MTHLIHFNYSIGDKVLLIKQPDPKYRTYGSYSCVFEPAEYTVNGLGFTVDERGIHTYYRLYAYCDKILDYHNRVTDDIIEPTSSGHHECDEEVCFDDLNGDEIEIGDTVLDHIVERYNREKNINYNFTFAGEGPVQRIEWFKEGRRNIDNSWHIISYEGVKFYYERHFLCSQRNGEPWLDGRKYGIISAVSTGYCIKKLPNSYVKDYVGTCIKRRFNPCTADEYDSHDLWLEHFGVYEEVKSLYNQKISEEKLKKSEKKENTSKKKDNNKLTKLVNELSEEERTELLKILNK